MSGPRVIELDAASPAARAGLLIGDEVRTLNGVVPRDVIQYQLLTDEAEVVLEVDRGGIEVTVVVDKGAGEPLGAVVHSALFDQVRTCDNHCEFCFIYQLPPGLRESLYLKDDDYRLSFLYGNYTTLTRFTEADVERVVSEGLSPLNVSIHATDPDVRADLLRNRRGGTSLRWLRALLDHGIEIHGQVVVCPGRNDADVLDQTMAGVLADYPELASLCVVPLGVSRYNPEPRMRPHTTTEAKAVIDTVERWQSVYVDVLGRRLTYLADEYYLLAGRDFPIAEHYDGFPMHEDGVGMARTFQREFTGQVDTPTGVAPGFFAWVEGAPADGYRSARSDGSQAVRIRPSSTAPVGVLTGSLGARVIGPLVDELARDDVRVIEVANQLFGGNIGVAGLLTASDLVPVLDAEPEGHRYLLPDVCLSKGRFLDGGSLDDLPRTVEVLASDGIALRRAVGTRS